MECPRCQGLMIAIRLDDAGSSPTREPVAGWTCLLCGESIDPGIASNRKSHAEPRRNGARPPGTPPGTSGEGKSRRERNIRNAEKRP